MALVRWGALIGYAVFVLAMGCNVSAWLDWLADLFPKSIRGTAIGASTFSASLCGVGGALLAGRLLRERPGMTTYALLYALAAVVAYLSISTFWLIRDRAESSAEDDTPAPPIRVMLARFAVSLREGNFRAFLIGRVCAALGFCMVPFIAVYYQSAGGGGLRPDVVVSCGAAMTVGMSLGPLVLGRLGDIHGHRLGVTLGTAGQVVALGVVLTLGGIMGCVIAYLFAGLAIGSGWVSHNNMLFETCPHDHRMAHITVGNLVMAAPLIIAPIAAGALVEVAGLRVLFWVCLGLSAVAVAWFATRVKEPRQLLMERASETLV